MMTTIEETVRMIEALLFAAAEPLSEADLAERLPAESEIDAALAALATLYRGRGVELARVGERWRFQTAADLAFLMSREREEPRRLSRAAQETLASEIAAFVASRIADPPARPKRIFIVDEIPMTSVGKVARFRLRQTTAMQALSSLAMDPTAVELTCTDSGAKVIDVSWRRTPQPEEVTALRRGASSLGLELRGEGGLELAGAPAPAA